MEVNRISYLELAKISKELKNLASEINTEINKISSAVALLENESGIKSVLGNVSLVDSTSKITSTFYNYNSIINKFSNFLDEEVIKGTQKVQNQIRHDVKKWESSLEKTNE